MQSKSGGNYERMERKESVDFWRVYREYMNVYVFMALFLISFTLSWIMVRPITESLSDEGVVRVENVVEKVSCLPRRRGSGSLSFWDGNGSRHIVLNSDCGRVDYSKMVGSHFVAYYYYHGERIPDGLLQLEVDGWFKIELEATNKTIPKRVVSAGVTMFFMFNAVYIFYRRARDHKAKHAAKDKGRQSSE